MNEKTVQSQAIISSATDRVEEQMNLNDAMDMYDEIEENMTDSIGKTARTAIPDKKQFIRIRGANEHNLKNISLDIPRPPPFL